MHIKFPSKDSAKQGYEDGLKGVIKSIGEHDPVDHAYHDAWELGELHSKREERKNALAQANDQLNKETERGEHRPAVGGHADHKHGGES